MKILWTLMLFLVISMSLVGQDECDKFELVSMYDFPPNPNPGGEHILILLTVNQNLNPGFDPHYTSFYFRSYNGDTVTIPTGRSLTLPTLTTDTIPYVLALTNGRANSDFPKDFKGDLIIETPTSGRFPPLSRCMLTFDLTTSSGEIKSYESLRVFPNPIEDFLNIESVEMLHEIRVIDISGRSVYYSNISSKTRKIDLSHVGPGTLIILATSETGEFFINRIAKGK